MSKIKAAPKTKKTKKTKVPPQVPAKKSNTSAEIESKTLYSDIEHTVYAEVMPSKIAQEDVSMDSGGKVKEIVYAELAFENNNS